VNAAIEKFAFVIGYWLIRSLYATCTMKIEGAARKDEARSLHPQGSFLLACWHEHVVMVLFAQTGDHFHPIVSRAGAGRFVGLVCRKFGHSPIHGSEDRGGKDKGGTAALFALLRCLKKGASVCITVDGSIGPRRHVKQGIIDLARKTNARIVPVGFSVNRYWELNTWDRLKIPKPFSTISVSYGEPIEIPSSVGTDQFPAMQAKVADAINLAESRTLEPGFLSEEISSKIGS
jgi:lysophospholipid acyltransferase (LPLAT)-like uncharacterized protein